MIHSVKGDNEDDKNVSKQTKDVKLNDNTNFLDNDSKYSKQQQHSKGDQYSNNITMKKELKFYKDWINETSYKRASIFADYDLEPQELSAIWRFLPVILYLGSIVSSMILVVSLGAAQNDFRGFCVLFSTLKYTLIGSVKENDLDINITDENILLEYHKFISPNLNKSSELAKIGTTFPQLNYETISVIRKRRQFNVTYAYNNTDTNSLSPNTSKDLGLASSNILTESYTNTLPNFSYSHTIVVNSSKALTILPNNSALLTNNIHKRDNYTWLIPTPSLVQSFNHTVLEKLEEDYYHYPSTNRGRKKSPTNNNQQVNLVPVATIDYIYSSWGPICICNFCIYIGVASLFYAFLCCMFFSLCQIGRKQYSTLEHPSRLVLPTLILSLIFSLLTIASSWLISKGINLWCQGIEDGPLLECEEVQNYVWINNEKHLINMKRTGKFYTFLRISEVMVQTAPEPLIFFKRSIA
ncbi:uncharacterized protein LOC135926531 isoform X2 [Gordionus sp. m RMFG-2023]|uniref:uncharacterized protein LOC135926531 isoform X2 n=1 Tax=Gordionus sp. m RMFG-2023 TaxID=3053472 RepID=UPI0031FC55D1